jgi:hypothetical protein
MFRRLEMRLGAIARRKWLTVLLIGLAPLVLRAMLLPWFPEPNPRVHDEFSHLLVADTFAHGRLVNPVHPMWVHFESMHILVRPVYASVFPVAQGIVLAAGRMFTGHPWTGVWLSIGFMCAALCWMLQGWVSPEWAMLGAALAAIRFGVFSYWMNSYYGGAMAAVGGALVLGALARIYRRRNWRDAAVMGIGFAILANSRPYEGVVFSLPVLAALTWLVWTRRRGLAFLLPLILVVGVTALALGYYFARFSGNPFLLPYSLYRNTLTMAPHFIWQSPRPEPIYHHRVLHDFYTGWEMNTYADARANRPPHDLLGKVKQYWRFYLGPFLTIPFVTLPWLWKRRRTRFLLLTGVLFFLGLAVEVWKAPHYAAPGMGLALLLVVEALRQLRQTAGAFLVPAVVVACLFSPVVGGYGVRPDGRDRARILKQLESTGERHLVLVRYQLTHDVGDEWVYNSADIDNAPVVWAREMDPTSNRELLAYFQGRRVWLVQPDSTPVALSPYDPALPPDPPFRFVKLGTDAIAVLRSPEEIRQKILRKVAEEYSQPYRFSCDQWNYVFTSVTGVEAPNVENGCSPPGQRGRIVSFEQWFAWLEKQR